MKKLKEVQGNFDYSAFTKYLQRIAGENRSSTTAKSIVVNIEHYISELPRDSKTSDTDLLLNRKSIEAYYVHLKEKGLQATTLAEKLRRMQMALQFILHQIDDTPLEIKHSYTGKVN